MNRKEQFDKLINYQTSTVLADYLAHYETDARLKAFLGIETELQLLDELGSDFYYLSARDISQNEGIFKCYKGENIKIDDNKRTCPLGIVYIRGAYDSKFSVDEAIIAPLKNAETPDDVLDFDWASPDDFDFSVLSTEESGGRITVGGLWTGIMGDCYRMCGFEKFLMLCALDPPFIKTLIDRVTEMYLELNDKYFTQLKGKMDIWFFGNDFGSQNGLLMSAEMWHGYFYDNIKKLCDLARSHGLKVMMHSCGGISEIIPYLINAGVDIIDPVQVTAKGMEPHCLDAKYGGKIIFHGGIDTQDILVNGSTEEVKTHCMEVIQEFGKTNGYIFAPSQILGSDIPLENIITMYSTIKEFNKKKRS